MDLIIPDLINLPDLAATHSLATQIAAKLQPGSVLALSGELGSGKTTFIQYLASALGINHRLISPTFVVMRQYPLPSVDGNFYHLDLYRLTTTNDVQTLGIEELIAENKHIIAIEWPDLVKPMLPDHTIYIKFDIDKQGTHRAQFAA
jgi:tRNA threonylcarbamoyladenosine biosynthesis protein TsaE